MSINHVLVPYNFTPEDEKALDLAVRLFAGKEKVRITLLYCYTPLPADKPDFSKPLGSWPAAVGQAILQNGMARKLQEYENTVRQVRLELVKQGFCEECIDYVFKPTERDLVDEVVQTVREGGYGVVVLGYRRGKAGRIFAKGLYDRVMQALKDTAVIVAT